MALAVTRDSCDDEWETWSFSSDCFDMESFDYSVKIPMSHFDLAGETADCDDNESFDGSVQLPMSHFNLAGEAKDKRLLSDENLEAYKNEIDLRSTFDEELEDSEYEIATKCAATTPIEVRGCRKMARNRRHPERQKADQNTEGFYASGTHCSVQKHMRFGCAIVRFGSEAQRASMMA
eukprot:TRINITY_DN15552_c0_g1_i1.p1 TRINITY_DN15552_c0_g1~~TRINITY_DN15552_c0_g1_i1.p1  ORF type:complete len:195 (+),score=31.95 TRINITY_DN15552_c0_g1_i1:52-585(+)